MNFGLAHEEPFRGLDPVPEPFLGSLIETRWRHRRQDITAGEGRSPRDSDDPVTGVADAAFFAKLADATSRTRRERHRPTQL